MSAKSNTAEFVVKATKKHKGKYNYAKVVYKGTHDKVTIACPIHGDFQQLAGNHLQGAGCRNCNFVGQGNRQRSTLETFVSRAIEIHGEKYSYAKTVYVRALAKITITCPDHGDFQQVANEHLRENGCRECSVISGSNLRRSTTKAFVKNATKLHGKKYSYAKVVYIGASTKVTITCRIHGDFEQTPSSHLNQGSGCLKCGGVRVGNILRTTLEVFVAKATKKHQGKYTYENSVYTKTHDKVTITCRIHGDFQQTTHDHLQGSGCRKCWRVRSGNLRRSNLEAFVKKATKLHGKKYGYKKVVYVNSGTEVVITCLIHGDFPQRPNSHLNGQGCMECSGKLQSTTVKFVARATKKHKGKYTYEKVVYTKIHGKVTITCPAHGDFQQQAGNHLQGMGCSTCRLSKGEIRVAEYLKSRADCADYQTQLVFPTCKAKRNLSFDFALPTLRVLIEFQGEQHYTGWRGKASGSMINVQHRDRIKRRWARKNGWLLICIPYWKDVDTYLDDKLAKMYDRLAA